MNRRTFVILLVVFAVVLIAAVLQGQNPTAPPPPDVQATLQNQPWLGRDLNLEVLNIQAIRLRDPKSDLAFTISRGANGEWSAPDQEGSLDLNTASIIAKTVALLPYQSTVPITADTNLEDYGFSPEGYFAIDVVMTDQTGHSIVIGNLAVTETAYYGIADERPEIYLLDRAALDFLASQLIKPPLT